MSYLPFFPFSYSMGKGEEDAGGSIVKTGGGIQPLISSNRRSKNIYP